MKTAIIRIFLVLACTTAQSVFAQQGDVRNWDSLEFCIKRIDIDCARAELQAIADSDLIRSDPLRYHMQEGRLALLEGRYEDAIAAFQLVNQHHPLSRSRQVYARYIAQIQATLGQFEQAYNTLVALVAAEAEEAELDLSPRWIRSARAYAGEQQFQAAYLAMEELMELNGHIPLGQRHLTNEAIWFGVAIYATGDWPLFKLITPPPVFPVEAGNLGLEDGYVDLTFTVTTNGTTQAIRVVQSSAEVFEPYAVRHAEGFRYKPQIAGGNPIDTTVEYRVHFQRR